MKAESEPITDDEWLLRRVHRLRFTPGKPIPIGRSAFEPRTTGRDVDVDGISLFRAACHADPVDILASLEPVRRKDQGVVRLLASEVRSIGLDVEPLPTTIPGHVVLPQLSAAEAHADPLRVAMLAHQLLKFAVGADRIVLWPEGLAPDP